MCCSNSALKLNTIIMSQDKVFNQKNGWVNLNVLNSKGGKPYIELDTFVPKKKANGTDSAPNQAPVQEADLPF